MRVKKLLLFTLAIGLISGTYLLKKNTEKNINVEVVNKNNVDCSQTISGKIVDKETNVPIKNAIISLYKDGKEIKTTKVNENGLYLFKLNCSKSYKIVVVAYGYFKYNFNIEASSKNNETISQNISLEKECFQTITGSVFNELSKKIIDNASVTLYLNGEETETLKVDDKGMYSFKIKCNTNYYIIANKLNYINSLYEFTTSKINAKKIEHDFILEPECIQTISGTIRNNVTEEPINGQIKLFLNNIEVQTIKVNNDGKYEIKFQCTTNYKIVASRTNYLEDSYNFLTDYIENKQPDYFHLKKDLFLEPNECFQIVSGKVLNKKTNKVIPNSIVSLTYQNQEIKTFNTNNDGSYYFNIKCNLNYELKAIKEGMASQMLLYQASAIKDEVKVKNIYLEDIVCKQLVTGIILNETTKLPLANIEVSLLNNNKEISQITTDNLGAFSFNIECGTKYTINAKNEDFSSKSIEFTTNNTRDTSTKKTIELTPLDCKQLVTGTILNETTKLPLANIEVSLLNNNKEINKVTTDNLGAFSFNIECDSDYTINTENENFSSKSIQFTTNNTRGTSTKKTIELNPLECKQTVTGIILNETTKLPLANIEVSLLNNNKEINKVTTDNLGEFSFNIECGTEYTINTKNENFSSKSIEFTTNNTRETSTKKTIELTPLDCKQLVTGTILNETTKLPLANIEVSLLNNNKEIYKVTTDNLGAFSFNIECGTEYTINTKNENFSSKSVEFTTDNTRETSTKKTIELTPLECKQTVTGIVLNETTKLPLANIEVSLLNNNKEINKVTTDNLGAFSFNIECGTEYTIDTKNENFSSKSIEFTTNNTRETSTKKTIELTPLECKQTVTGIVLNETTKLPLTNIEVSLLNNNKEISQITTDNLGEFSFNIECGTEYTIKTKNEDFSSKSIEFTTNNTRGTSTKKTIELTPLDCKQTVTGIIRDKISKKPLPKSTITLYQNNKVVSTYTVGEDGIYEFTLECSSSYKLTVFKNNSVEAFNLKTAIENGRTLTLHIDIEPLNCVQYINGLVEENITKNPIPNAKVVLLNNTKIIKETTTDSNGTFYFEIECNKAYNLSTEKANYTTAKEKVISTNKTSYPHNITLTIEPIIDFVVKKGIRYIETKPIVFDLDEYEIKNETKLELNKVVYNMNQNQAITVEVNYHTDSRGPDEYNLQLTINRAKATKNYLISKGIDANRIKANGYGETKLLNNCANNVKCTDEEHEINRRTEFKVTK